MEHRPAFHLLNHFIDRNRIRMADDKANNRFMTAFSQCSRYYYDLEIIQRRYDQVSSDFIENAQRVMADSSHYNQVRSIDLTQRLHLEIESFYLFAKLFLDRTADALAFFFGFRWGGRGATFGKLAEKYDDMRQSRKNLPSIPAELQKVIQDLRHDLVRYKTDMIEHLQEPGIVHATVFSLVDGKPRISPTTLHNSPDEIAKYAAQHTRTPDELFESLDAYLAALLEFLEDHTQASPLVSQMP